MKRLLGGAVGGVLGLGAAALVVPLAGCPFGECKQVVIADGTYQVTKTSGGALGSFVVASGKLVHSVAVGTDQTDEYVVTYAVAPGP